MNAKTADCVNEKMRKINQISYHSNEDEMRWERECFSFREIESNRLVFAGVAAAHKSDFCSEFATHISFGKSVQAERATRIFNLLQSGQSLSTHTSRGEFFHSDIGWRTRINGLQYVAHNADSRWIVALMPALNERIVIVTIFILAAFGEHFNEIDWLFLWCFKVIWWVGSFFPLAVPMRRIAVFDGIRSEFRVGSSLMKSKLFMIYFCRRIRTVAINAHHCMSISFLHSKHFFSPHLFCGDAMIVCIYFTVNWIPLWAHKFSQAFISNRM